MLLFRVRDRPIVLKFYRALQIFNLLGIFVIVVMVLCQHKDNSVGMAYYATMAQVIPVIVIAIHLQKGLVGKGGWRLLSAANTVFPPVLGEIGALLALATNQSTTLTLVFTLLALSVLLIDYIVAITFPE